MSLRVDPATWGAVSIPHASRQPWNTDLTEESARGFDIYIVHLCSDMPCRCVAKIVIRKYPDRATLDQDDMYIDLLELYPCIADISIAS